MFNIQVEYPSFDEEVEIIKKTTGNEKPKIEAVLSATEILEFQRLVRELPVTENVYQYAVGLTHKTRVDNEANEIAKEFLDWGAGPRASQNLILAAKCHALINSKLSPDIENVKAIAKPVLRHRIIRNFRAEAEGIEIDDIIDKLL
jgi:MoxR-like ATPase